LLDLVALLRLTGAQVAFAPAAGSYTAMLSDHEVQFTPGGSLAVVDGRLTPLPGPVRMLEGHVVGAPATAVVLLEPLGWTLAGGIEQPRLFPVASGERIQIELVPSANGTLVVVRGTSQKPRLAASPGQVTLTFGSPLELTQPIRPQSELLGGDVHENTLTLRLAPGSYSIEVRNGDAPPLKAQVEIRESLEVFPSTLPTKRDSAYAAVAKISFDGMQYRRDIGARAL